MNYIDNEQAAFEWFRNKYDSTAELQGGYNSNVSDIYSPKLGGFIEIKMINHKQGARCGQFTIGTMSENPYSLSIYNGEHEQTTFHNFVRYHYSNKEVVAFIIGTNIDEYRLLTMEEFLTNCVFSVQSYGKRSGTCSCPIKYQEGILQSESGVSMCVIDKKLYCKDKSRWGDYFIFQEQEFFISPKCNGEVRKCSNTKNLTYHIEVKMGG